MRKFHAPWRFCKKRYFHGEFGDKGRLTWNILHLISVYPTKRREFGNPKLKEPNFPIDLFSSSQVASNPLGDQFRTQKIPKMVSKMESTRGVLEPKIFGSYLVSSTLKKIFKNIKKILVEVETIAFQGKTMRKSAPPKNRST